MLNPLQTLTPHKWTTQPQQEHIVLHHAPLTDIRDRDLPGEGTSQEAWGSGGHKSEPLRHECFSPDSSRDPEDSPPQLYARARLRLHAHQPAFWWLGTNRPGRNLVY